MAYRGIRNKLIGAQANLSGIINRLLGPLAVSSVPPFPLWEYVTEMVNPTPAFTERDGLKIMEVPTAILQMYGGWDPNQWTPPSTNQQWQTIDGPTWTQLSDAPWDGRHNFCCVKLSDNWVYVIGGDDQINPGVAQVDAWKRDPSTGLWQLITADMGSVFGNRISFSFCKDNQDRIYIIGGDISDCIRTSDGGVTWTKMGDLPASFSNFANGAAAFYNGSIVIVGGTLNQPRVAKSTNFGATWTDMPNMPSTMTNTTGWCSLLVWEGILWYLAGTGNNGNQVGIYWTTDLLTWNQLSTFTLKARHASGFGTFGDDAYIVAGNGAPDVNRIYKTAYVPLTTKAWWSLQKVNPDYSGVNIRVFRPASSTYADIGFTGNSLDVTALTAFAAGSEVLVNIIYDKSGNGFDFIQNNDAFMPAICDSSGNVIMDNGNPAIDFGSSGTKGMSLAAPLQLTSKYSISAVCNMDSGTRILFADTGGNAYFFFNEANLYHSNGNGTEPFAEETSTLFTSGQQRLVEVYRNRMRINFYDNSVGHTGAPSYSAGGYPSYRDTPTELQHIGREYGFGYAYKGKLQEIKVMCGVIASDSATTNQAEINARYNIYP